MGLHEDCRNDSQETVASGLIQATVKDSSVGFARVRYGACYTRILMHHPRATASPPSKRLLRKEQIQLGRGARRGESVVPSDSTSYPEPISQPVTWAFSPTLTLLQMIDPSIFALRTSDGCQHQHRRTFATERKCTNPSAIFTKSQITAFDILTFFPITQCRPIKLFLIELLSPTLDELGSSESAETCALGSMLLGSSETVPGAWFLRGRFWRFGGMVRRYCIAGNG